MPEMPSEAESTNPVTGSGSFAPELVTDEEPHPGYREYDSAGNRASPLSLPMGAAIGPSAGVARIAQTTAPVGTVGQIGKPVDGGKQTPAIGELPTFTAAELGDMGQAPPLTPEEQSQIEIDQPSIPYIGYPRPDLGEMPAEYVGKGPPPWASPVDPYSSEALDQKMREHFEGGAQPDGTIEMEDDFVGDPLDPNVPHELAMRKLHGESDEQLSDRETDDRLMRESYARTGRLKQAAANETDAKMSLDNLRRRNDKFEATYREIEEEGKQIAATRIDPDHWADSRSTPQKIAAIIGAIVGGFAARQNGGRNSGLDMIDAEIERDIAAQRANLENRKGELGRRQSMLDKAYERSQDMFKAEAIAREAAWNNVVATIDDQAANVNPEGYRRLQLERARRMALGRAEAARRAAAEAEAKRQYEQDEALRKDIKLKTDIEHQRNQDRNDRTRAGADWMRAKTDARKTNAEIERERREAEPLPIDYWKATYPDNPVPPHDMSRKDYDAFLARSGKGAEAAKSKADVEVKQVEARVAKSGPGGSPYALGDQDGNAYRNKDGSVFEVKDDNSRSRLRDLGAFAKNTRRMADLAKIMKAKYGGASEALGSDEAQEMKALAAATDFETYRGFGLGAPSAGDQKMATDARGGKDITSFIFDATPGFEAYAKNAEEKLNAEMRNLGFTGAAPKMKRLEAAQAMERTQLQNLDVFDAPEIDSAGVDPDIAKRAAARANEAVPALARQAGTGALGLMAQKNKERLDRGLIEPADELASRKIIRRAYRKRMQEQFGRAVAKGVAGRAQTAEEGTKYPPALTDADIDKALGIVEQKGE